MAGGDMRVISTPGLMMGGASEMKTIDANSVKSGNMTESRDVKDTRTGKTQTMFFTPEGAQAFDSLTWGKDGNGGAMKIEQDPGMLSRFFLGDIKEQNVGKP